MTDRVRISRALTWFSWGLLFTQQALDAFLLQLPWIIWLGKLLPLMLFVPGMLRDKPRSFIWLCFVSLLYFIAMVERIFAQPDSALAATGLVAVILLFISAMLYARWRSVELSSIEAQPGVSDHE